MAMETKPFVRLGYSVKDTDEIVNNMNVLFASYHVHYQKLRNFHWNVTGRDSSTCMRNSKNFTILQKPNIDDLAERIRVFGAMPMATLSEYWQARE